MKNLDINIMKSLLKQLWFQSIDCSEPIQHMGFQVSEVSKITGKTNGEVIIYLNFLINKKYIHQLSVEPLLYEFTDMGKSVQSDSDIEELLYNV